MPRPEDDLPWTPRCTLSPMRRLGVALALAAGVPAFLAAAGLVGILTDLCPGLG